MKIINLYLTTFLFVSFFINCSLENPTKYKTVYLHDTLFLNDTITIKDTTTDTLFVASQKSDLSVIGLLVGGILKQDTILNDSFYASISLSSNPEINNAKIYFGNHVLSYDNNQKSFEFFNGILSDFSLLPNIGIANYSTSFKDTAQHYNCTIIYPYLSDGNFLYDTLIDSTSLPKKAYNVKFKSDSGIVYDSVDYFSNYLPYRIRLDQNLLVSWQSNAQWYAIEIRKYRDMSYYYDIIGMPIDTFTQDTFFTVSHELFYQDTNLNDSLNYDFLYIQIIPVNGPKPALWNNYVSFSKCGYLFCLRQINDYYTLNASLKYISQPNLGKRSSYLTNFSPSSSVEIVNNLLRKKLVNK